MGGDFFAMIQLFLQEKKKKKVVLMKADWVQWDHVCMHVLFYILYTGI